MPYGLEEGVFQNALEKIEGMDAAHPRTLLKVINRIFKRKPVGGDGISNRTLRNLNLNWSLCSETTKDYHTPESDRPISFFITISNIVETLLLAKMSDHLDEHRLLDD
ncbi:hypothetical protein Trydic_g10380 [Trypoxylus dichotomus]